MADVTRSVAPVAGDADRGDHANDHGAPAAPPDPRAVRVRLAPASRLADEPPLRVAPAAEPLRPTNPTTGLGPLGGSAVPGPVPGKERVLAQRQPEVDGVPADVTVRAAGPTRWVLEEADHRTRVVLEVMVQVDGGIRRREVLVDGFRFEVDVESERIAALRERASRGRVASAHSGPLDVHAIIPGRVVAVSVAPGDPVTAGQQLLVVEAMKMQNELRSPRDGTISRVAVAPGVNIEVGDLLVVIS
jgi:biotin carboxyl carrier protein